LKKFGLANFLQAGEAERESEKGAQGSKAQPERANGRGAGRRSAWPSPAAGAWRAAPPAGACPGTRLSATGRVRCAMQRSPISTVPRSNRRPILARKDSRPTMVSPSAVGRGGAVGSSRSKPSGIASSPARTRGVGEPVLPHDAVVTRVDDDDAVAVVVVRHDQAVGSCSASDGFLSMAVSRQERRTSRRWRRSGGSSGSGPPPGGS